MLLELKILILLVMANGAPIIARHLFRDCCTWPIDGGLKMPGGSRLLGHSKTLRGLVAAVVMTAAIAPLMGVDWHWGAAIGGLAMLGDLLASFTKRRLGYPTSSQAVGLDQIPESLVPLLVVAPAFDLQPWSIFMIVLAFTVLVPLLSRLFYLLGIRRRPY
ncbi:MAG: CDP-archaeol synthase [Candidatus Thiodiazotropha sp.]